MKNLRVCKRNYFIRDKVFLLETDKLYQCSYFTRTYYLKHKRVLNFVEVTSEFGISHNFQLDDFDSLFYSEKELRKLKIEKIKNSYENIMY